MIDYSTPCYTHEDHAAACALAAKEKRVLRQYVRVRYHDHTCCAVIRDAWDDPDNKPMWKLEIIEPLKAKMSFPVRLVRKCSGTDGHCQCEKKSDPLSTNG